MAKVATSERPEVVGGYRETLRAVRRHKGISLVDLAAKIGTAGGARLHLGRVERGADGASLPLVVAWANALDLELRLRKGDEVLVLVPGMDMKDVTAWVATQGISPTDLAVLARMSRMTMALWRKGTKRPNFTSVEKIMTALDGSIELVFKEEEGDRS